eukprot:CAMPEP_0184710294 /NCGR_PEP_ID=MMETSP0314-20130426/1162_1 /TAXON_ID=38298 /ORGANISM="Rhodella maculata, Strain CCMP 736" /LENGTH=83 /DNA_ID=CAMNT_0027172115 /DNA_START=13 /DNA_END=264 /DNA_ORIENTATION=+
MNTPPASSPAPQLTTLKIRIRRSGSEAAESGSLRGSLLMRGAVGKGGRESEDVKRWEREVGSVLKETFRVREPTLDEMYKSLM